MKDQIKVHKRRDVFLQPFSEGLVTGIDTYISSARGSCCHQRYDRNAV